MKITNYITGITLIFLFTLSIQSCSDQFEVTIIGNINSNSGKFTIIDNSPNSRTFDDFTASKDRYTIDVEYGGDFEISFIPTGPITDFTYMYKGYISKSKEFPITIETGTIIDLGELIMEEPVQVKFTIPDFEYVNEAFVDFTTFSESGFEANMDGASEVGGILRGYLYENQLNRVKVFQRNAFGELVSVTYEYYAEDLTFDEEIELK